MFFTIPNLPLGDIFRVFTGQGVRVEDSVVATAHQAGQALHTDNVATAVLGGIARVGQELGSRILAIHIRWALEANDLCERGRKLSETSKDRYKFKYYVLG